MTQRPTRFRGYDVLQKWDTPSWDDPTRSVISNRLAVASQPTFFDQEEWLTVQALCLCIVPQASANPIIPIAEMLDAHLSEGGQDGYRRHEMPPSHLAWKQGVAAIDAQSLQQFGTHFSQATEAERRQLLTNMQQGKLEHPAWDRLPQKLFFTDRVLHDICAAYYSHPHAWSEIGFGGPANPRGYVRLYFDRKDPWEATEKSADDVDQIDSAHRGNRLG